MHEPVVMAGRPGEVPGAVEWLTDVERERAARFVRELDRRAFVAAHLLVRLCASELLGIDPAKLTLLQVCDVHGPGHGKPYLRDHPDLGVSLSHTRDYVCAGAGDGRVGVDAEHIPEGPMDESLAHQILSAAERETIQGNGEVIRQWVRKEALIKRGELTLDTMNHTTTDWSRYHLLEWQDGPVLVTAITDAPARRAAIPRIP
ncbi:4'-phosphopantetheinyl transferase family protein [Nonomuraea sp. NPDC050556]|uniref:4'-phosphopantetheinyl transferase family protein n=1 Tax=Nonomuraea sp. NPDC050556 TaxID=3364369 RepID=UPI0037AB1891